MDLLQRKLTKAEWESIELPISTNELRIIDLIKAGYADVNLKRNHTLSLLKYMKILLNSAIDRYVYIHYLQAKLLEIGKKYDLFIDTIEMGNHAMKKADIFRFANTDKHLETNKSTIYEYIILDLLEKMYKYKYAKTAKNAKTMKTEIKKKREEEGMSGSNSSNGDWLYYYYTIKTIIEYNVELVNACFKSMVKTLISRLDEEVNLVDLVSQGYALIEKNEYLLKYADEKLYDHQKRLFTACKQPNPKLVLYIAPTGTGKTLSPLGLAEHHKIIFVCAARHVGLSLARSAISANKRVAFAFGCTDTDDIRLHYAAAKEYTIHKKSGGIGKVDNSVGDKVEIMICDIKSYIPAMNYMLAFNSKEKIIWYWDEPTITLDYKEHEFHAIIKKNWTDNLIPNIVLSSATLPQLAELTETITDFRSRFDETDIHEIISHDCNKSIPLLNRDGFVEMPHYLFTDYSKIVEVVAHCQKYKTLLRYIDLAEAIKFITYINQHGDYITHPRYKIENYFGVFEMVTMANIKLYYLNVLGALQAEKWSEIYTYMSNTRHKKMLSTINIVTSDAYTLTDGPTIFLAEDIDKIAQFYLQSASIPETLLKEILGRIEYNTRINEKMAIMEKDYSDGTKKDEQKEKKMNEGRVDPEMKRLMDKIDGLRQQYKSVRLPHEYVPNTKEHLYKCANKMAMANANANANNANANNANNAAKPFTSEISEHDVEKIMRIDDISDQWKLLLLLGIGVFTTTHKSDRYTEIMKNLAQQQKLYLIIASTDYIYGTNYQFCHGYIGKDLGTMSQEKCIQAMGRVGRNKLQQDYSVRFREDDLILKLFQEETNKPEVVNMSLLFTSE